MNLIELIKYRRDNYLNTLEDPKEIIIGLPSGNYCTGYEYGLNSLILTRCSDLDCPDINDCLTLDKLLDLLTYNKKEILYYDKYIDQRGKVLDIRIIEKNYYKLFSKKLTIPEVAIL